MNGVVHIVSGAQRNATVVLESNGEAPIPPSFGPGVLGRDITFQALLRDTADPVGLKRSNGLRVDVTLQAPWNPETSRRALVGSPRLRVSLPRSAASSVTAGFVRFPPCDFRSRSSPSRSSEERCSS